MPRSWVVPSGVSVLINVFIFTTGLGYFGLRISDCGLMKNCGLWIEEEFRIADLGLRNEEIIDLCIIPKSLPIRNRKSEFRNHLLSFIGYRVINSCRFA